MTDTRDRQAMERGQEWARYLDVEDVLEQQFVPLNGRWLLAIGDSWFDYWPKRDALAMLGKKYGYQFETVAQAGTKLAEMAPPPDWDPSDPPPLPPSGHGKQIHQMLQLVKRMPQARKDATRAFLLSGGGNDVAGEAVVLASLLNAAGSGKPPVDDEAVAQVVGKDLREVLVLMLSAVTAIGRKYFGRDVPIVMHGYGYPVPDGRGVLGSAWLQHVLRGKGYTDMQAGTDIMKVLIDRLNEMQLKVLADNPVAFTHVRHVDVRPVLSNKLPEQYKKSWQNELHPSFLEQGFVKVAETLEDVLKTLP